MPNPNDSNQERARFEDDPLYQQARDLKIDSELVQSSWLGPTADAVLVGPSGAGKTSLLTALPAACSHVDGLEIQLIPGPIFGKLLGGKPVPTLESQVYDFQVHFRNWSTPSTHFDQSFQVAISDPKGGDLKPSADLRSILSLARTASWLILVADSGDPQPHFWRRLIPEMIAVLAAQRTDRTVQLARASAEPPTSGKPAAVALERRLPQQRILVLLSKIDLAIAATMANLGQEKDLALRTMVGASQEDFARCIEVVPTIEHLFGEALGLLRAGLPREASLAIGLTSSEGLAAGAGSWRQRRPFGIREALIFLATGRCQWPVVSIDSFKDLELQMAEGR
jgi:hypothetical protein